MVECIYQKIQRDKTALHRALDQVKQDAERHKQEPTSGRNEGAFGRVLHLSQDSEALGFKSAMPAIQGTCFAEPLHREKQSEPVTADWAKPLLPFVVYVPIDISLMLT